ncbi:LysR family transcriptional regulator [Pseudomonas fluorescens]|uniref:LysR family transcriptional regulator n=1 Tax=Pseudomonas fluorescens TaxID=294 RepID=UPI0017847646|nr:LysR family transcriptional regulator [Pseudomonas fluorescens]
MRMRHLRYFLVVAEELSFSRAAARVHIEASPLSRAIKELEAELGAHLLHRSRGRIELTWAGEVFREEARKMLSFMEGARNRVHAAARGYRGHLRIGLADSLAHPRLTKLLARCREEEPLTEVRIIEMPFSEMVKALAHDQIDAGFTVHSEISDKFIKKVAWTDRPAIAVPKNHPLLSLEKISLQEIVRHSLVLYHPERCFGGYNIIHRWFRDYALPMPSIVEYVSGHELMMTLVAAGYGVGFALESQVKLYHHPDIIIRPVTDDVPSAVTFLAMLNKPYSEQLSRFITRTQRVGEVDTS